MTRWIVAGACVCFAACGGARQTAVPRAASGFQDVATESGLVFRHNNGSSGQYYLPEIMGSGVALIDYDRDGDLDIFLVQGSALDSGPPQFPPAPGAKRGSRLFRNDGTPGGRLHVTDVTEQAGIALESYGMGVATGDYDSDGWPDLYVTGFGKAVLYHNNGNGTFSDVTRAAGVEDSLWSTSATFVDYDRDGLLDLFVLHYVDFTVAGNKVCQSPTGERDYCTPKAYHGLPAKLYRNLGNGRFEDATRRSGVGAAYGPGLGVVTGDFNNDGWPDLYVANDTAANLLWMNQKNGTFREVALESGAAYAGDGIARAGMGVTAEDIDDDGSEDLLVTNLIREGVTLFRNTGRGEFDDATLRYGLAALTTPFTGFGVRWFDYDNDGRLDLFIANGAVTLMEKQRGRPFPYEQTDQLLHNEGTRFRDVSSTSGAAFSGASIGRGAAFGDIDNDGDVDMVVTNNNGAVKLLLNGVSPKGHWLEIRLNAGARVGVERRGRPTVWRRARTDGSYLSASDGRVHFGLGTDTRVDAVVVRWAGGRTERFAGVAADRIIELKEGASR